MIELKQLTETNYTTSAELKMPNGTVEKVTVVYCPLTTKVLKELDEIRADSERGSAHMAALIVRGLPELTKDGQPVELNLDLFEAMDARYVNAIVAAVTNDFYEIEPEKTEEKSEDATA